MSRPYIGVTGFTSSREVGQAIDAFPYCGGRSLMVGVLVSRKTLRGERNKWHRRYPSIDRVKDIFVDDPRCLNLVHFCASETPPTDEELDKLLCIAGPDCHGFQWNGLHPNAEQLQRFAKGRHLTHVLQVRLDAFEETAKRYPPWTRYLFDMSGGRGVEFSAADMDAVRDACIKSGVKMREVGIAGGLCAERVRELGLGELNRKTSYDAEGKLRDDADGGGRLVPEKVADYLKAFASSAHPYPDFAAWRDHEPALLLEWIRHCSVFDTDAVLAACDEAALLGAAARKTLVGLLADERSIVRDAVADILTTLADQ